MSKSRLLEFNTEFIKKLFDLSGKKAAITGGAGGIGLVIALGYRVYGVSEIALIDYSDEKLNEASRIFREMLYYEPLLIKADISRKDQAEQAVQKIIEEFSEIDILVNSHGIFQWVEAEVMTEEDWDRMMDVNLKGVFLMCQAVGRHMIARRKGKIINIASMSGTIVNKPQPQSHYNTSKAGVIMLTRSLASEWSKYNINVNCISPGYTLTPPVEKFLSEHKEYEGTWIEMIPLKRFAKPTDIVGAAIFLASSASDYITGQNIIIDGGYTIW
jgi:NAD(P)-dependent dehydrogenase (short-subunit alcohol dehydrogenase family)